MMETDRKKFTTQESPDAGTAQASTKQTLSTRTNNEFYDNEAKIGRPWWISKPNCTHWTR